MLNFKELSRKAGLISNELQTGKRYHMEEVLGRDLTITAVAFVKGLNRETGALVVFPILRTAEITDGYISAGNKMTRDNILLWLTSAGDDPSIADENGDGGTPVKLNAELAEQGGLPVIFTKNTSQEGRKYITLAFRE